jgi:hypothetical protein
MQSRAVYCTAEVPSPMEQSLAHFPPEPEPERRAQGVEEQPPGYLAWN